MKKSLILLALVLLLPIVSAEIIISQPNPVYNLGDVLNFQVTLHPGQSLNDFASVSIVCENSSIEVYKSPASMDEGTSKSFDVSVPLTPSIIGSSSGACLVKAKYGSDSLEGSSFRITNNIDIQLNLNALQYSPGDLVVIDGKALKENGLPAEGFLHLKISNLTLTFPVKQGVISANFSLPANTAPGDLNFEAEVYEKSKSGEVTNLGFTIKNAKIKQVIKSIAIKLDALEVTPGAPLNYEIDAFDQVGSEVSKEVTVILSKPDGSHYSSKLVRTGNTEYILFPLDVDSGIWTITANLEGLIESKTFSMPEIQRANFKFVNDTLLIENIGNVPYTKSIEVKIGDKIIVKQVSLGLNGSKVFKLLAPNANYPVIVNDGYTNASVFSLPLTGRAIDIGEVKSFTGSILPAMIIILALIIFYIFLKIKKFRGQKLLPRSLSEYHNRNPLVKAAVSSDASVEEGSRETATIVALRLPSTGLANASNDMLSSLKQKAISRKAHSESRGNFMLFLLTEKLSGQDYEMESVKLAQDIQRTIKAAVSSANVQVPSSIGITKGEVITSGSLGRLFSFTALGNAVSKAQKLASQANGEILVTDAVKIKVGTRARFSRIPGNEAWKVDNVVNRDEYSGFVSGFVKRYNKK